MSVMISHGPFSDEADATCHLVVVLCTSCDRTCYDVIEVVVDCCVLVVTVL